MDTVVFGNLTWDMMNYVSYMVDNEVKMNTKHAKMMYQHTLLFLSSLTMLIPCEPCRKFYLMCWCTHPPPEFEKGLSLVDWVYDIHSTVTVKIKVTKCSLINPSECLAPILSRQELSRRFDCLSRGASISIPAILDFMFITSEGVQRANSKRNQRRQAWMIMFNSLTYILSLDPYMKIVRISMKDASEHSAKTTENTINLPWKISLCVSDIICNKMGIKLVKHSETIKRIKNACGPICEWMEQYLCN